MNGTSFREICADQTLIAALVVVITTSVAEKEKEEDNEHKDFTIAAEKASSRSEHTKTSHG